MVNWQQYGLKKNPFDTLPLIEGGDIDIGEAFVGRDKESNYINELLGSIPRLCLAICGDVGVGKTSLANFVKHISKHKSNKRLFSFRREIEACDDLLNKKNFLIEIIGSILREIRLLEPNLFKNELLSKLSQIVDITQSLSISGGASIAGWGLNLDQNKNFNQPLNFSTTILEEYFCSLLKFIKTHEIAKQKYSGLIIHVNNFDVVLAKEKNKSQVINFFDEIRDLLQMEDCYYLFLGPRNFFKDIISSQQRVKSIFHQSSLMINPLSKTEIVKALDQRMRLLKSEDVKEYIKPVENEVIFHLYDIYSGDIRSIMATLMDILTQYSDKVAKTLKLNEAKILLARDRWDRLDRLINLTNEQKEVLECFINSEEPLTVSQLSDKIGKAQSNVSGYYLKPLKEGNIIEEKSRKGNTVYYGITEEYISLKWFIEAKQNLEQEIRKEQGQLSLF